MSTKLHAGCIDERTGVALVLTDGQRHEHPVFETVFAQLPQEHRLTHAIMDQGYDSDRIRATLTAHALVPVIPPKSNRTEPGVYDQALYKLREQIEIV